MRKSIYSVLSAVALSAAADIAIAESHGYGLRSPAVLLISVDIILLALPVSLIFVLTGILCKLPGLGGQFRSAVWSRVLISAWLPVAVSWLWHDRGLSSWIIQVVALLALFSVALVELKSVIKSPRLGGTATAWVVLVAVAAWAMVLTPLPGAHAVHEAPQSDVASIGSPRGPNVLLIVLDTVRADSLEPYGNVALDGSWLSRYARSATVYENAVADSSYTLPSHASIFTGLYSRAHGAHEVSESAVGSVSGADIDWLGHLKVSPLSDDAHTLAEILRDDGYATGAICGNTGYLHRIFNLDQGFDTYIDELGSQTEWRPAGIRVGNRLPFIGSHPLFVRLVEGNEIYYRLASEVNQLALEWLDTHGDRPFFLFLNYMDAHDPYWSIGEGTRSVLRGDVHRTVDYDAIRSKQREITGAERDSLWGAYQSGLRYLDRQLESLFSELELRGELDDSIVVIVGDHGDSFGEHHKLEHQQSVYQSEVHVPLIVRNPGQTRADRYSPVVHVADVFSTVLDRLQLPIPSDLQGVVLGAGERPFPVVTQLGRYDRNYSERAIYEWPWKLIVRSDGLAELYDISADPQELNDVLKSNPDVVGRMSTQLAAFLDSVRPRFDSEPLESDAEAMDRLKSLGYVE